MLYGNSATLPSSQENQYKREFLYYFQETQGGVNALIDGSETMNSLTPDKRDKIKTWYETLMLHDNSGLKIGTGKGISLDNFS